jgi:hypothetical protein
MIFILCLIIVSLFLVACEDDRGDVIFVNAQKECSLNGTYCHLFRGTGTVNLTFNVTGDMVYEVQST